MPWHIKLGELGGLDVVLMAERDSLSRAGKFSVALEGAGSYAVTNIENPKKCPALIQPLEQRLRGLDGKLAEHRAIRDKMERDLERYQERAGLPFPSEAELQQVVPLRDQLRTLLSRQESEEEGEKEEVQDKIRFIVDVYQGLSLKAENGLAEVEKAVDVSEVEPLAAPGLRQHVAGPADQLDEEDGEAVTTVPAGTTPEAEAGSVEVLETEASESAAAVVEAEPVETEAVEPVEPEPAREASPEEPAATEPQSTVETAPTPAPAEAATVEPEPVETAPAAVTADVSVTTEHPVGRGQMGLFDTGEAAAPKRPRPSTRVARPIRANVVQLGLFDTEPAIQRTEASEPAPAAEPPEAAMDQGQDGQPSHAEDAILAVGGDLAAMGVSSQPTAEHREARAVQPAAFEVRQEPPAGDPEEASRWRDSLSSGDRMDMEDMLDNGGFAGAPDPTERAVIGRFTSMVGERPRLAEIIHDSIEHFESFGSMVERIERETGKEEKPSPAEIRGAKSLYNATLARKSGWDMGR